MCVCVCVCVCVCDCDCDCDCVCMCVCLYPSTVEASSVCNDVLEILECLDQRSCFVGMLLDVFAEFLHLSF